MREVNFRRLSVLIRICSDRGREYKESWNIYVFGIIYYLGYHSFASILYIIIMINSLLTSGLVHVDYILELKGLNFKLKPIRLWGATHATGLA